MSDLTPIERDEAALAAMTPGRWFADHAEQCGEVCAPDGTCLFHRDVEYDNTFAADCYGIARLRNRMPLYVRYFRAVEARDAIPVDFAGAAERADELYAARKALLEDSDET